MNPANENRGTAECRLPVRASKVDPPDFQPRISRIIADGQKQSVQIREIGGQICRGRAGIMQWDRGEPRRAGGAQALVRLWRIQARSGPAPDSIRRPEVGGHLSVDDISVSARKNRPFTCVPAQWHAISKGAALHGER